MEGTGGGGQRGEERGGAATKPSWRPLITGLPLASPGGCSRRGWPSACHCPSHLSCSAAAGAPPLSLPRCLATPTGVRLAAPRAIVSFCCASSPLDFPQACSSALPPPPLLPSFRLSSLAYPPLIPQGPPHLLRSLPSPGLAPSPLSFALCLRFSASGGTVPDIQSCCIATWRTRRSPSKY